MAQYLESHVNESGKLKLKLLRSSDIHSRLSSYHLSSGSKIQWSTFFPASVQRLNRCIRATGFYFTKKDIQTILKPSYNIKTAQIMAIKRHKIGFILCDGSVMVKRDNSTMVIKSIKDVRDWLNEVYELKIIAEVDAFFFQQTPTSWFHQVRGLISLLKSSAITTNMMVL